MKWNYYNDSDKYVCEWARNLIKASLVPDGEVDERPIQEVSPDDLRGFRQCHFFCGILGWSLALRLAGADELHCWTGSCPCQPFSAAGKGKASSDERHLWPEWFRLIRAVRPATILGEQVEAAIGWGWLDLVHSDMEPEGYTIRSAVLPACSVGAPHIRQRLWFVADTGHNAGRSKQREQLQERHSWLGQSSEIVGELGNANGAASERRTGSVLGAEAQERGAGLTDGCELNRLADASETGELADATHNGQSRQQGTRSGRAGATHNFWSNLIWLPCTDGKQRPTQSGLFPLAHGVSGRVAKLRAAGNAIVPQVAAEFIKASMT